MNKKSSRKLHIELEIRIQSSGNFLDFFLGLSIIADRLKIGGKEKKN
jgi:hypothetical protein